MKKGNKIINKRAPGYQKERGERQQSRILAALATAPASTFELADTLHLSRTCVHRHVIALQEKPNRRVRVVDYEVVVPGRPRGIYGLGKSADLSIASWQRKRVLGAITERISALDLIDKLGMLPGSTYRYLKQLLAKKQIHVVFWGWSDRTPYAIYEKGPGYNVPRPKAMPADPVTPKRQVHGIFAALGI